MILEFSNIDIMHINISYIGLKRIFLLYLKEYYKFFVINYYNLLQHVINVIHLM